MQKQKTWKDFAIIILILLSGIFIYQFVMWGVNNETISPIWFTLILVYIVLVYPQVMGINAIRDINWIMDEDFDGSPAYRSKKDWIIFLNDTNLKDYFVDGPIWKTVVYYLMNISSVLMILSILYVNLLVVFIDLGPNFAYVAIYAMFGSTITYIFTKSLVLGNLINYYASPIVALTAIIYPLGFYVLHLSIKSYSYQMDSIMATNALGDED